MKTHSCREEDGIIREQGGAVLDVSVVNVLLTFEVHGLLLFVHLLVDVAHSGILNWKKLRGPTHTYIRTYASVSIITNFSN